MARVWNSYKDINIAVQTIRTAMEKTGRIPPALVRAYQESIQKASRGLVQSFYELLAKECPEAMKYFG